jgi:hypothetical protein
LGERTVKVKESEGKHTRIHGLAFVMKRSANAKSQAGEQSFHRGERRWLRRENIDPRGQG